MTDRHLNARHRIALLNGKLVSPAVPLDADIAATVTAGTDIDAERDAFQTPEVYLSDVGYADLQAEYDSGKGFDILTADGEVSFRYAYNAADADEKAAAFLDSEGKSLSRMLFNLEIEVEFSGNIANDWSSPLRAGTLDTIDVLEIRRALELRGEIAEFVSNYVYGCDRLPGIDDVLAHLEEKELLPEHDFWIADPFVVAAAALAVDVIDDADFPEDVAEDALKERDEDLIIVGRDPAHNHQIQVGREIDERGTWVSVEHFKDYRSVVAWAEDDREHDGTWSHAA